jgi:hypothetical protein
VGIGTASPTSRLHVQGGDIYASSNINGTAGNTAWRLQPQYVNSAPFPDNFRITNGWDPIAGTGQLNYAGVGINLNSFQGGSQIEFYTGATNNAVPTERMRILSNGNVGIGATDPIYPLDIQTGTAGANSTNTALRLFSGAFATGTSNTSIRIEKGVGFGGIISGYLTQGVGAGLLFSTLNTGTQKDVMRLTDLGNVGIGTASPSEVGNPGTLLHVYDSSSNNPTITVDASGGTGQARIRLKAGQAPSTFRANRIDFFSNTNVIWTQITDYDQNGKNEMNFHSLGKGYASGGVLTLTQAGNVGIGTASPSSNVAVDTVGIVRGTKGVATNCGSVANLGTGGTVIHTFSPSPGGGHALLTVSGPGNQPTPYLFGFVRWVANLGQASLTVISNSGITATIDVNNTQITLATTSGTLSRVVWNITYLPTPNYLGDYFF